MLEIKALNPYTCLRASDALRACGHHCQGQGQHSIVAPWGQQLCPRPPAQAANPPTLSGTQPPSLFQPVLATSVIRERGKGEERICCSEANWE